MRQVSTETLRHYDRKGILKPSFVDPSNGRRFYSILDCERLGTIKELQQLGLSLDEIHDFMTHRTPEKSMELLLERKASIELEMERIAALHQIVQKRIESFQRVLDPQDHSPFQFKHLPRRVFLTLGDEGWVSSQYDVWQVATRLECRMTSLGLTILPVFASSNYAGIIPEERIHDEKFPIQMVFQLDETHTIPDTPWIRIIEAGAYMCHVGNHPFWEPEPAIKHLMYEAAQCGYELCGDVLQVIQVDDTVTNQQKDICFEYQFPVRKMNRDPFT